MFQCVLRRTLASRYLFLTQRFCISSYGCITKHAFHKPTCEQIFYKTSERRHAYLPCHSASNYGHICRYHYTANTASSEVENTSLESRLVERWVYEVDKFGRLDVNIPFDVEISTLDPQEYSEMNKALVSIFTKEEGQNDKARSFSDICGLKVVDNKESQTLSVSSSLADGIVLPIICSIQIPLKFDIKVESSQPCDVSIQKTECDTIDVLMMGGECRLRSVKCGHISVENKKGNIICQSQLQGNIKLKTGGNGTITGKRFQGTYVACETEAGSLAVESIYADKNTFSSCHGNIHLGNCHGTTNVKIDTGNLVVDALDGDLAAQLESGDVDVFIERHQSVKLQTDIGNISLKCRDDLQSEVVLVGDALTVENTDFQHTVSQHDGQNKYTGFIKASDDRKIDAQTKKGSIRISTQSWLSSMGLKFGS